MSILLKYPVDEEAVSPCTIIILVSSFQVDSRVPKHFLHHCLFMNSTCFFLMLKTLQTSFPTSVSTLICNCACHPKSTRHGRQAYSLMRRKFQAMPSECCHSVTAQRLRSVLNSRFRKSRWVSLTCSALCPCLSSPAKNDMPE